MDALYLHLLLNHIPVIGTIGALLLLGAAFVTRSRDLAVAGLVAVVMVALATIPVYLTGEPAEERVEHLAGFDHDAIHEHEDAADYAIFFMEVSGAVALIPLAMSRRRPVSRAWIAITMLITLFSLSVIARTAYLGGKIRHTEVGAGPSRYEDD
jgi:hypothetical protein